MTIDEQTSAPFLFCEPQLQLQQGLIARAAYPAIEAWLYQVT